MLLISGLRFANWREASPVHVNRCLQRSGYLNAVQAIQAMREQYKIFFLFTSCSLFRSCSMGPNLAVLTQANSPLERGKINKRTLLNVWAWGVCLNSDCITSCLIFIFKRYILERQHSLPTKALGWESKPLHSVSLPHTMATLSQHGPVGHTRSLLAQMWGQDLVEPTSPFHAAQHLALFSASRGASVTLSCNIFILSGYYLFFLVQKALTHRDVAVRWSFWAWCQVYILHIHEKWQEMGTWLAFQDQKVQLYVEMSM